MNLLQRAAAGSETAKTGESDRFQRGCLTVPAPFESDDRQPLENTYDRSSVHMRHWAFFHSHGVYSMPMSMQHRDLK